MQPEPEDAALGPMFLPMPDEQAEAQRRRLQAAGTLTPDILRAALDEMGIESRKIPEPQWPLPPAGTGWSDWQVTSSGWLEELGRVVRETWVAWAREQPDPKPSWLVPWDDLDNGQREVDMRIGAAVAQSERKRFSRLVHEHTEICDAQCCLRAIRDDLLGGIGE